MGKDGEPEVTETRRDGGQPFLTPSPSISAASRLVTLTLQPLLLSHEIDGVRKEKERLTAIISFPWSFTRLGSFVTSSHSLPSVTH